MRASIHAAFFAVAFAATCQGQGPSIEIPSEIKATGRWVRLSPKTDAVGVLYVALDGEEAFPSEELKDPRRFLFDTKGLNGRYRFAAIGASATGELVRVDFVVIVGNGPTPTPPGPGPMPPDPKPPDPAGVVKFLVVVEETADATAARGIYLADLTLAARLKDKGIKIRVVDKDVVGTDGKPPADVARFIADARDKPLARVYLVDEKGKTIFAGNMPADPARLIELLSRFGG